MLHVLWCSILGWYCCKVIQRCNGGLVSWWSMGSHEFLPSAHHALNHIL